MIFLNLIDTKAYADIYDLQGKAVEDKKVERHSKPKPHLIEIGEKVKCAVCDLYVKKNTY